MRILNRYKASKMGFSSDRRKRKRQHRLAAKNIMSQGGGGIFRVVVEWHLYQARYL